MRGNQSRTYPKLPVSSLRSPDWSFLLLDLFLWTSGYGTRMHLFYTVCCITDTRYWRVLLQENCAVNILFCLYCWQINVLNVVFIRPFIKIFDPDLVPKDAFWKAIFRELENISKWKVFTNLHHADPHWTVDSRRSFTWRLLLALEPRPCKSQTILY